MSSDKPKNMRVQLRQNPDIEVRSVNGVSIISNLHEFITTFRQDLPLHDGKEPYLSQNVIARYSMTPAFAKILFNALGSTIKQYESKHGEIITHIPRGFT